MQRWFAMPEFILRTETDEKSDAATRVAFSSHPGIVKKILRLKLYASIPKNIFVFILERLIGMMRQLIPDVLCHIPDLGRRIREASVAALPCESTTSYPVHHDKLGCEFLKLPHHIGNRLRDTIPDENMNMAERPSDRYGNMILLPEIFPHDSMNYRECFKRNDIGAILHGENDMEIDVGKRVGHVPYRDWKIRRRYAGRILGWDILSPMVALR